MLFFQRYEPQTQALTTGRTSLTSTTYNACRPWPGLGSPSVLSHLHNGAHKRPTSQGENKALKQQPSRHIKNELPIWTLPTGHTDERRIGSTSNGKGDRGRQQHSLALPQTTHLRSATKEETGWLPFIPWRENGTPHWVDNIATYLAVATPMLPTPPPPMYHQQEERLPDQI